MVDYVGEGYERGEAQREAGSSAASNNTNGRGLRLWRRYGGKRMENLEADQAFGLFNFMRSSGQPCLLLCSRAHTAMFWRKPKSKKAGRNSTVYSRR